MAFFEELAFATAAAKTETGADDDGEDVDHDVVKEFRGMEDTSVWICFN